LAASPEDSNGNGNGSGGGEGIEDKAGEGGSPGSLAKLEVLFRIKAALMPRTGEVCTIFSNHVFHIVGPILVEKLG
jgi:hypothetical protein